MISAQWDQNLWRAINDYRAADDDDAEASCERRIHDIIRTLKAPRTDTVLFVEREDGITEEFPDPVYLSIDHGTVIVYDTHGLIAAYAHGTWRTVARAERGEPKILKFEGKGES